MKKTFVFSLKIKNCDKIFKKGFEPGVLVTQEIKFDDKDTPGWSTDMFAMAVIKQQDALIERHIEVLVEEK